MTIKVTITKDEDQNDRNVHVAIVSKDVFGNSSVHPGHIRLLETGVPSEFYIHDMQDLRVYETDQSLPE